MSILLSKSKVKQYMQCKKALWLKSKKPEVEVFSKESLSKFKNGNQIGELSQQVFPDGLMVNSRKNVDKIKKTLEFLPLKKVIFEAAFEYKSSICQVDILRPFFDEDGLFQGWDIIEVKAGTSAKDEYIEDIAIQYYIITNSMAIPIHKFYIWHINKTATGPSDIFQEEEIQERLIPYLPKYDTVFDGALSTLDEVEEPKCSIGPHCDSPYECGFKNYCWSHVPKNKKTIFDIPGFTKVWKAYELGLIDVNDANKEELTKLGANPNIMQAMISGEMYVNKEGIKKFVDSLVHPLSALDFESMQYVVPTFPNATPYQQVPFQYALIVQDEKDAENRLCDGFLNQTDQDPREDLVKSLVSEVPAQGHILSYNMTFERYILKGLASLFPAYAKELNSIAARLIDPLPTIREHLYHPDFGKSYSLKSVIKALYGDELSYAHLVVQNGQEAQDKYAELMLEDDIIKRIDINEQLRDYCNADVFNLMLIIKYLKELVIDS